jgi:hypothetical protein
MSPSTAKSTAVLVTALVLALGACSEGTSPSGGTSNALSQAQANDISSDVTLDLDELAELSMYDGSNGVSLGAAPHGGVSTQSGPPAACVTVSPTPVVNSDGDAVPDSVRFDYSNCTFTRFGGTVTDALSGTIDFVDPLPTQANLGVRHHFNDFTRTRTNSVTPLRSFKAVYNGTREWGGDADTLGHTITNFVSQWTHPSGRVTTHTKDWVARFTAATPGTISLVTPLPAGSFTVNGTGSWATLNRTWSVQTTTVADLVYDPTCQVAPRFTAGQVDLVVTRNGVVTNVSIVFTACGTYTVTRTSGTTT